MSELLLLRAQIVDVPLMRRDFDRPPLDDLDAVPRQPGDLLGIVREQANLGDAQVAQDLRRDAVVAAVVLEAELEVCFDRVTALILKRIGADLVRQPDTSALIRS